MKWNGKKSVKLKLPSIKEIDSVTTLETFQNSLDNGVKKEKAKEEKKEMLGSSALRAEVHSNGFAKHVEVPAAGFDNKESRPLLANSPPSFQNHMKKPDTLKLDMSPIGYV